MHYWCLQNIFHIKTYAWNLKCPFSRANTMEMVPCIEAYTNESIHQ